jgi:LysR family glycine cleavage system transcriptional activator
MRRKIPNTWALVAFEASARHQSFTRAAVELSLTQSAVCRQIAGLEEFLGIRLFLRSKRGVKLTEAGLAYSRQIASRLDEVERDTLALMAGRGVGGTLELAVVPTFATRWLIPRLGKFQREHPDITVNLTTSTRPFMFEGSDFDAAIYFGDAHWPGTDAISLMRENLVPVCSPALVAPQTTLSAADLACYPLLQQSTRPYAWRQWFASTDLAVANDMTGPRYELFSMLATAAMQGMGIALVPRFLFEEDIAAGRLAAPVNKVVLSATHYRLIYPEQKADRPALRHFASWLASEAQAFASVAGLADTKVGAGGTAGESPAGN